MTRAYNTATTQQNSGGAVSGITAGKNKVLNGDMSIAQRGTSFTDISNSDLYTLDRWSVRNQNLGTVTATQDTTVPTGAGFGKSLKLTCTTADASPAASDRLRIQQRFEGIEFQDLAYGSASAKSLTLSFWVRSSKTGTYVVEFWTTQSASSKNISTTYTIATANTWQQVKITIPGDTVSDIVNTTGQGFEFYIWLGAGTDYTSGTLNTSWNTPVTANRAVGQVNWADSDTATFYLTGVQLEVGSVATPFSRAGGTIAGELAACQRYFIMLTKNIYETIMNACAYSASEIDGVVSLPVSMRTGPTLYQQTGTDYFAFYRNGGIDSFNSLTIGTISNSFQSIVLYNATEIASTAGQAGFVRQYNSSAYLGLSAEI